uniref:Ig-like domain-containing protein n=1 Tax=Pyxicephalus adspersus TaxID=30357 RepID=A0AAV3ASF4_PYXAD|nr:TPA: hypothetical protein GDO54_009678 [Pyxicephalus adspersus]
MIFYETGCCGGIVLTQSSDHIMVSPGEDAVITCIVSESIYLSTWKVDGLAWTQHRPGQNGRGLIFDAVKRISGIPEKYVGFGSGREFRLTIKGAGEGDEGRYYCHQYAQLPYTQ